MKYGYELAAMVLATFLALMGAAFAADPLFQAHAWILFFILSGSSIVLMRRVQFAPAGQAEGSRRETLQATWMR